MKWQDAVLIAVALMSGVRVWQGHVQAKVARKKLEAWRDRNEEQER